MRQKKYLIDTFKINDLDEGIRITSLAISQTLGRGSALLAHQLAFVLCRRPTFDREGRDWHYTTEENLRLEIGYSVRHIRRILKKLVNAGLLIIKRFKDKKCGRVNCYSLVGADESITDCDQRNIGTMKKTIERLKNSTLLFGAARLCNRVKNVTADIMTAFNKDEERSKRTPISNNIYSNKTENSLTSHLKSVCTRLGIQSIDESISPGDSACAKPWSLVGFEANTEGGSKYEGKKGQRSWTDGGVVMNGNPLRFTDAMAQQMVDIYNETFSGIKRNFTPVKQPGWFTHEMRAVWRESLREDMEVWRGVCRACTASSWMRSDVFNMRLGWLLSPANLKRIMNNEWGCRYDGPDLVGMRKRERAHAITQHMEHTIATADVSDDEKDVRFALMDALGGVHYKAWFEDRPWSRNGDGWTVYVPSDFHVDRMSNQFAKELEKFNLKIVKKTIGAT